MPIGRKSAAKEGEAPVIELPQAKVKILEATLYDEPRDIQKQDGSWFTADPNLNCKLVVEDDLADGSYDGVEFYDSFRLKQEDDGEWTVRDGTKLGALAKARYGNNFFDTDQVLDEADLVGFVFMTKLQQKTDIRGTKMQGTICNHETIMAVPDPTKKKGKGKAAAEKSAEKAADSPPSPAPTDADKLNEEDFEEIPF